MKQIKQFPKLEKPQPLEPLIEALVQEFAPLYIYHFAKKVHQKKLNSVFCDGEGERQSIYYLFLVVEGKVSIESRVQEFADGNYKVIIQIHEKEQVLGSVNHCNGYLASVINKGKLRYAAPGIEKLGTLRLPNIKKRLGRAILHWRKRREMAKGFFAAAEQAIEIGQERVSLFLLHHATEQACVGLIYVFMDYQPDGRNLEHLLYLSACFSNLPFQHFMGTPDNEALLKIMIKCLSRGGYDDGFSLNNHSIYRFSELVESFVKLADDLCEAQFKVLQEEVDQVKVLKGGTLNG
ncbi:hypothetical protein QWY86_10830 [Pedobacter aquatilis]|uniref:hypothetical protein n=1 Tax=Pedobacter aquatilis TaxID=351343 RepID=UPI0025B5E275|nr:hypothetical protein [Pedobacter aquatilis]MDN3587165.1 hypothetical protein [Pedobacter aquatilis]